MFVRLAIKMGELIIGLNLIELKSNKKRVMLGRSGVILPLNGIMDWNEDHGQGRYVLGRGTKQLVREDVDAKIPE